jgi:hypothetical protein
VPDLRAIPDGPRCERCGAVLVEVDNPMRRELRHRRGTQCKEPTMAEVHVDHPGEIRWFKRYGPRTVLGPCPHTTCLHDSQAVIAWGPDYRRYELIVCDTPEGCNGHCRAWTDGSARTTTPWLHVTDEGA